MRKTPRRCDGSRWIFTTSPGGHHGTTSIRNHSTECTARYVREQSQGNVPRGQPLAPADPLRGPRRDGRLDRRRYGRARAGNRHRRVPRYDHRAGLERRRWPGGRGCLAPTNNPLVESRLYAMTQLAVHDALNAVSPHAESYASHFRAPRWSSLDAAVAAASHDAMLAVFRHFPEPFGQACGDLGAASVEQFYVSSLARVPDGPAKQAGLAVGHRAASAVLALRTGDGSTTPLIDPDFPQG